MVEAKATTTAKVPGILAKIAAVQKEVGTIPKNGKGPSQKGSFEYVKFDDIVQKVRDLFVEHGIVSSVETLDYTVRPEQVGNRMVVNSWIRVKYTYTDIADGSSVSSVSAGEGSDIGGDTATRKAFSQALKIVLLHTFNIVTGDEVDTDGAAPKDLPAVAQSAPSGSVVSAETLESVRGDIQSIIEGNYVNKATGELVEAYPGGGAAVNALGNALTKKAQTAWFASLTDLQKVRAALLEKK